MKKRSKKQASSLTKRQVKNSRSGKHKKYKAGAVFGPALPSATAIAAAPVKLIRRPLKVISAFGKAVFGPGF